MKKTLSILALAMLWACTPQPTETPKEAEAPETEKKGLSFFITSRGPGDGADLGGLAGADAHCQALAAAVGAGDRTWRAI